MRAMLYKKMMHSAPNLWPVFMVFASCILILIITSLAVKLDRPFSRKNTIPLGFKGAEDIMMDIPNIMDCGYIDIRTLAKSPIYKNPFSTSRVFESQSFACVPGTYRDDLGSRRVFESLGAVEMEGKQDIRGYISQNTFHTAPMMLNLLHNIILRLVKVMRQHWIDIYFFLFVYSQLHSIRLSFPKKPEIRCLVENHPIPTSLAMKINLLDNEIAHINVPLAIGCILPLTISVFILPLAQERICHIRIIQVHSGLGLNMYWAMSLFWDFLTFFIYAVIIVIIFASTNIGDFGPFENMLMLLLISVYGLAALPITYVISIYVNKSIMKAFLASVLIHGITGLFIYIVYWDVANSNVVFFYGACMSPGFALLDGISNIYIRCLEERVCRGKCAGLEGCTTHNMHELVANCQCK